jgi:hypothetical protein
MKNGLLAFAFLIITACNPDLVLPQGNTAGAAGSDNDYVAPGPSNPDANDGQGGMDDGSVGPGPSNPDMNGQGGTPANSAGAGGTPQNDAGTGGVTNTGGTAGSGGSPSNNGGAGGSEPSGGQGGSPSNGGSGGSDPGPVTGTLTIALAHPNQTTTHVYKKSDWINADVTMTAKAFIQDIILVEGTVYTFNGQTDGGDWWCAGAGQKTVLIAATWNDELIKVVPKTWVVNGVAGCNFEVTAADIVCPANDQDCDGYTADAAVQSQKDCDDMDPLKFPNQLETWGDPYDADCNGAVDPPSWKYAVGGLAMGANLVQLVDAGSWSNQTNDFTVMYPMSWNGATNKYEASVGNWVAPKEYVVRYRMNAGDPWIWASYKQPNGSCVALLTHQVTETINNTVVAFAMSSLSYCHFVKQ